MKHEMSPLQRELQALKIWDEVQCTTYPDYYQGYPKIITAGHGYLAVRVDDINAEIAKPFATFIGKRAYYLEEDCDATSFLDKLNQ
jgi:hypothetical protein